VVRFYAVWLASLTAGILSFSVSATKASAQTTYPFNASYSGESTLVSIANGVSKVTITGNSTDAPYGLTKFSNTNYGLIDITAGTVQFNPDATKFGLKNLPLGDLTFFGEGNDKLIGNIVGSGKLDFKNLVSTLTGTFNITGGEGKFASANGTFNFVENDILNVDPTVPSKSRFVLNGSFTTPQAVPEASNVVGILGIGAIGVGLLLRRRHRYVTLIN
jgi:hypothetical protein